MNGGWIAVACADHVAFGVTGGFMQVCHGKAAPLRRMRPGQHVAYYSPTEAFRGHQLLQAFTAIGIIRDSEPYCFDMGGGFRPWRRDVDWLVGRQISAPFWKSWNSPLVAVPAGVFRFALESWR
jgi:hypothetical protein